LLVKLCIGYLGSIYLLGMVIDSSICELWPTSIYLLSSANENEF
jgi:hypothetical protein